jgi:hypothetical protein
MGNFSKENLVILEVTDMADVRGAEGVGIKGVLVRSKRADDIKYYSGDLRGLKEIIV